jgi:uncharacterized membrane protein YgcG
MNGPKTKGGLRKTVRQIEDEFGVDKTVEDIVDGILSIFDNDDDEEEEEESSDSIFDSDSSDDSDSGDFGDGDFGGGGSDDDW